MKHIKKKFLFEDFIKNKDFEKDKNFEFIKPNNLTKENRKRLEKENNIIIQTTAGDNIFAFAYNNNGRQALVPLPDLTLVYFDTAYNFNRARDKKQKEILNLLSNINTFSEANASMLYNYYGLSSSCIINLFTTIESFMNSFIPSNEKYERVGNKCIEIFNIQQIQQHLSFDEKIKKVIPFFHNKDFFKNKPLPSQHITNLKNIRDKIIHTKADYTGTRSNFYF